MPNLIITDEEVLSYMGDNFDFSKVISKPSNYDPMFTSKYHAKTDAWARDGG